MNIKNKKGIMPPLTIAIPIYLISAFVAVSFVGTVSDGTAKRNGKVIWCKMQGRNADTCNQTYGYIPQN